MKMYLKIVQSTALLPYLMSNLKFPTLMKVKSHRYFSPSPRPVFGDDVQNDNNMNNNTNLETVI